jgi:hypothetical protein
MTRPYITGAAARVLAALKLHSTSAAIAKFCGLSERSTRKILHKYVGRGWVLQTKSTRGRGNEYRRKGASEVTTPTIKTWQERAGTFKETFLGHGAMAHFGKEVQAEIDELRAALELARVKTYCVSISDIAVERDALRAELDRLKKQEPAKLVWVFDPATGGSVQIPLYLAAGAQPDTKELAELRADAERYAAKRKEIFLTNMRMQVSGPRSTEEEFNANYDANCDKAIKGYVTDHRGVLAFNAKMVEPTHCRSDERCQYAIDHGAEGLGHCPAGKCCPTRRFTSSACGRRLRNCARRRPGRPGVN